MNYSWLQAKKKKKRFVWHKHPHWWQMRSSFWLGWKAEEMSRVSGMDVIVFLLWVPLLSECVCACVSFPAVMLAKHTQVQKQGAHKCTFHIMLCAFMYIHVLYLRSEQTLWTHFVFGDSLAIPSSHLTCGISQLTYRNSWMACGCFDLKADLCGPVLF